MQILKALFALLALVQVAHAQVRQSGTVTQKHAACWTTNGVIQDCGTAAVPFISTLGTLGEGPTICATSAAITGAYNRLCLAANTAGAAEISLQNFGGAAAQGLQFNINGNVTTLPSSPGGTFATETPPFVANHIATYSNTSGNLIDGGMSLVGGNITSGNWQGGAVAIGFGGTGATTAAQARNNLGLGSMATQNSNAVAITGGAIGGLPSPSASADAATKGYVDATATGLKILSPVRLATATVLPGTPTYANGASGVGATLTAGSNGALSIDSVLTVAANRVLVKDQASTTGCTVANAGCQNGIYTVTTVGDGSNPYVLTRVTDFDTAAEMTAGSYTLVTAGSTNASASFVLQNTVTTVGTTPAVFNQFSSTTSGVASFNGRTGVVVPTSSDYTAAIVNYTAPGTGAVARTTASKVSDVVSIKDYGAVCDNSTDDTTAIQKAVTAAQVTLASVYSPAGTCVITSQINVTLPITLYGDGPGASIWRQTSGSANGIVFEYNPIGYRHGGGIRNMSVESGAGYLSTTFLGTGSTGAGIIVKHALGGFVMDTFGIYNFGYGLSIYADVGSGGTFGMAVNNFDILFFQNDGIQIDFSGRYGGDRFFSNGTIHNNGFTGINTGSAGIHIYQSGGDQFRTISMAKANINVLIAPSAGQIVTYLFFDSIVADNAIFDNWALNGDAGGITGIYMINCWAAASNTGSGFTTFGQFLQDVRWVGGRMRENALYGWHHFSGNDVYVQDSSITNNSANSANTYPGVLIDANISNWGVQNSQVGNTLAGTNQADGIVATAGTGTAYLVSGNNFKNPGAGKTGFVNGPGITTGVGLNVP